MQMPSDHFDYRPLPRSSPDPVGPCFAMAMAEDLLIQSQLTMISCSAGTSSAVCNSESSRVVHLLAAQAL